MCRICASCQPTEPPPVQPFRPTISWACFPYSVSLRCHPLDLGYGTSADMYSSPRAQWAGDLDGIYTEFREDGEDNLWYKRPSKNDLWYPCKGWTREQLDSHRTLKRVVP